MGHRSEPRRSAPAMRVTTRIRAGSCTCRRVITIRSSGDFSRRIRSTRTPMTGANFNRYGYANGNPFRYYDPSGRYTCQGSDEDCGAVAGAIDSLSEASSNSSLSFGISLDEVANFYGAPNVPNGVAFIGQNRGVLRDSSGGTTTTGGETSIRTSDGYNRRYSRGSNRSRISRQACRVGRS